MKLPKIGDMVLYNDGVKQSAAMVVAVNKNEKEITADSLNLKVFTDTPNGMSQYMRNVPQGDIVGTWQWPDIDLKRDEDSGIE